MGRQMAGEYHRYGATSELSSGDEFTLWVPHLPPLIATLSTIETIFKTRLRHVGCSEWSIPDRSEQVLTGAHLGSERDTPNA
jgi:hypothetical protein